MATDISADLRRRVAARANYCCEYCRLPETDGGFGHHVDHILSRKHGGGSAMDNLAFACMTCNRNKGADIASVDPMTGNLVPLFHPPTQDWFEHFEIDGVLLHPLTGVARATVQILRLNAPERMEERRILRSLGRYPET